MDMQKKLGLSDAYTCLKEADPDKAGHILVDALSEDLENPEIIFTLKCANFWSERMAKIQNFSSPFEKGEAIIDQWKNFCSVFPVRSGEHEQSLYCVRKGVFTKAKEYYEAILKEPSGAQKSEIYSRLGLCNKKLGDYESALKFLSDAVSKAPDSAAVLAEMADTYALAGESRTAKLLFREAFFMNAQDIDVELLESELFCNLFEQVADLGYKGAVLLEWIPVYGVLYGVFNIKRTLRVYEIAKLKQSIYALENELKEASSEPEELIPRLINRYFWLIDHYTMSGDDRSKNNELLLKIKLLDTDIHEKYTV